MPSRERLFRTNRAGAAIEPNHWDIGRGFSRRHVVQLQIGGIASQERGTFLRVHLHAMQFERIGWYSLTPVGADAIKSTSRSPEIGISRKPSTSMAARAWFTVMLLTAILRNTGYRGETFASFEWTSFRGQRKNDPLPVG